MSVLCVGFKVDSGFFIEGWPVLSQGGRGKDASRFFVGGVVFFSAFGVRRGFLPFLPRSPVFPFGLGVFVSPFPLRTVTGCFFFSRESRQIIFSSAF